MKNRLLRRFLPVMLVTALLLVASQLSSCASPAYYWQAASGHLSLMHARQPVDEVIEEGNLDASTTQKLRLSRDIRSYAIHQLGLPDNGSYDEFVQTGREAVVWNVIAAPEFSLAPKTWCFPVAGCVPYRGYFEEARAERFAEKLRRQDLDVAVSPATAYSTLGWFDDPLLDTMLKRSDAQFAALIFHELAHQQLYVKGDSRFNEAYASFVETVGVKQWLRDRGREDAFEQWQVLADAEKAFSALLQSTRDELRKIYQSGAEPDVLRARKQLAFDKLRGDYSTLVESAWRGKNYFGNWFTNTPNNARFALLDTYHGANCAFANLYAKAGSDIHEFHALAASKSELSAPERHEWLEQDCTGIASKDEL